MRTPIDREPPTQEQIDTIGELFVEREEVYSLEALADMAKTRTGAGMAIRTLRACARKKVTS